MGIRGNYHNKNKEAKGLLEAINITSLSKIVQPTALILA